MKTHPASSSHPLKSGILVVVGLGLSVVFFGLAVCAQIRDWNYKTVSLEYSARRGMVLAGIRQAMETDDAAGLQKIERAYSGKVSDPEFVSTLHRAKVAMRSKTMEKTFIMAKILDISRQQEARKSAANEF